MAVPNTPTRSLGYVNPYQQSFFQTNYDADEINVALIWPNNLRIYDQMNRQDSQVAAILRAVTLPIRRAKYRVDPAGARATVVKVVSQDLGLPVAGQDPGKAPARRRGGFSWSEHLRQALLELRYGHMFFVRTYDVTSGMARLNTVSPRMPRTIYQLKIGLDGSLQAIEQLAPIGSPSPTVEIPMAYLVPYVNEMEGANWTGTSLLRPAYKHWLIKDRLLRVQAQAIDRNGMGIPVYKGDPDQEGADRDAGLDTATSIRSGDNSGTWIPAGADLKLMGVEGNVPSAMDPINYHDQQIARAMLAHFLNLGTQTSSATGSYNLGSTFQDFFAMSLQTIADHVCDVVTQYIIEDLVDQNWGSSEPAPRLVCDDIGAQHDATAQALLMLAQAGVLDPDMPLKQFIRQTYNLPANDPETAAAPVQPATQPATDPNQGGNQ